MSEPSHDPTLAALRDDYRQRAKRHAHDCVLLATVTSEKLAAELIDKAIAHHEQSVIKGA